MGAVVRECFMNRNQASFHAATVPYHRPSVRYISEHASESKTAKEAERQRQRKRNLPALHLFLGPGEL